MVFGFLRLLGAQKTLRKIVPGRIEIWRYNEYAMVVLATIMHATKLLANPSAPQNGKGMVRLHSKKRLDVQQCLLETQLSKTSMHQCFQDQGRIGFSRTN